MADKEGLARRKGHPTYRCTRCGDMFVSLDFEAEASSLLPLMSGPGVMEANGVSRVTLHTCGDGGIGIGSITGLTPTEKIQKAIAKQQTRSRSVN